MTSNPILDAALAWQAAGASVIPVAADGTKRPACPWKRYQAERADADQIHAWFDRPGYGLGIICGAVSGQLEMLEFEGRAVTEGLLKKASDIMADNGQADLWTLVCTGCVDTSPSGGIHLLYRVGGQVAGNQKIARRPSSDAELEAAPGARVQVLIETRGEGGYTVAAPSGGTVHKTGGSWTRVAGGPATLPILSTDQRDALHAVLGCLDALPEETPEPQPETAAGGNVAPIGVGSGLRPGDDFAAKVGWDDILCPQGWTKAHKEGAGWAWTRPGKKTADGISATTGTRGDGDNLYIWSTSTDLPSEEPLSKLYVYAHYHHGGDMSAAARDLASRGYGDQGKRPALTLIGGTAVDGTSALAPAPVPVQAAGEHTDRANGARMADRWSGRLKWVPSRGAWLAWDGVRWAWSDDNGPALAAAEDTADTLPDQGGKDDANFKFKMRSLSRRSLESAAKLASTHPGMRVDMDALDADPWTLATPDGLVDLHTGDMRPPDPEALCTRSTACGADMTMPTPMWDAFLADTFGGDQEMTGYVAQLAGLSAVGEVRAHVMPFIFGPGANGKSVFLDVLLGILGDYASSAPPGFLMAGKNDESAIARLAGLRLVVCSEVGIRDRFDEAKVKLLTGGDTLTARFLYGKHFTFTPSHTLWLAGNHQPRVEAGGESFWRRTRMIGFDHTVPPDKRVDGLAHRLIAEEGPGILAWIIKGAISAASGLDEPERVTEATQRYAVEEDALARFMSDRIHLGGGDAVRTQTSDVRHAYTQWCRDEGEEEMNATAFGRELRSRWGVKLTRSHGKKFYPNLALLADEDEEEDPADRRWNL